jgi:hypothetical protein
MLLILLCFHQFPGNGFQRWTFTFFGVPRLSPCLTYSNCLLTHYLTNEPTQFYSSELSQNDSSRVMTLSIAQELLSYIFCFLVVACQRILMSQYRISCARKYENTTSKA